LSVIINTATNNQKQPKATESNQFKMKGNKCMKVAVQMNGRRALPGQVGPPLKGKSFSGHLSDMQIKDRIRGEILQYKAEIKAGKYNNDADKLCEVLNKISVGYKMIELFGGKIV